MQGCEALCRILCFVCSYICIARNAWWSCNCRLGMVRSESSVPKPLRSLLGMFSGPRSAHIMDMQFKNVQLQLQHIDE
ncbi:hypothetical protein RchiOBHm_Chr5g0030731 [Rosa chinensis]|uniref:Uncharacterized protein n=1 Tax=Rosa chinensis TaxID=74649 RepID=A0A2P6Q9Y6_ROSCH|nr:hypothetical protein RchiOBHm_Chr5g0030731 [Rosa chinensis]